MNQHIPGHIIDGAVDVIINTRDFCGNEKLAAYEYAVEQGYGDNDSLKIVRIANFRANAKWNAFKKAAGVNPKHTW